MKRIELALKEYPDGITLHKSKGIIRDTKILDCYPYFLNCGTDDLDEDTKIGNIPNITGCRGISCKECWDKPIDI